MRIGVAILPEYRWPEAAALWRRAEQLGFAHGWTYDHLAWRDLRDAPWFGAVPTLAAAATVTERMRLGPLVASPNFRHPVSFARELTALDDISGGRLELGIGAGGEGWDAVMLGQDAWTRRERTARFHEFVELLDRLLREPECSTTGEYYSAVDARTYPGCVQRPRVPFAVAASGPKGMALAARHAQTWVTVGDPAGSAQTPTALGVRDVARQLGLLVDACEREGRDPDEIRKLVLAGPVLEEGLDSVSAFDDTLAAYGAIGVTDFVVHWPRSNEPYRGDIADFEAVVGSALDRPR